MKKTINYGLLMLVMLFTMASNIFADNKYGLKDNIQDGVILHCFDWTLADIQEEIPNIAKAGFTAVQTSPVHERAGKGSVWYDVYRPYDFKIGNGLGTEADLKALCAKAHEYGVKVIVDVVANHTSDEHYWFKESLKGDDNPYHNYYYWRKGKGKDGKKPPNNWLSTFEGGAWEYNEKLKEFYLHVFAKKQPDLNMDNPKVREEVKDILRFWLDMGVDGFREDVITFISKPADMPNGFPRPAATGIEHYKNGPKVHDYLKEFRDEVLGKYDCFTVGESPMMTMKNE